MAMADLYFRYGVMGAGKTKNLIEMYRVLKSWRNETDVRILRPEIDTRSADGYVESREGQRELCRSFSRNEDLFELVRSESTIRCVFIDEAQFLARKQVQELARATKELNVTVFCYGLQTDFRGDLFAASAELFSLADHLEEISRSCWFCQKRAVCNLRIQDGRPVYEGVQIQIGGDESYLPVCLEHYYHPELEA